MRGRAVPRLVFLAITNIAIFAVGAATTGATFVGPCNLQSAASQLPETKVLLTEIVIATASGNGGINVSGIALANLSGVLAAVRTLLQVSADDPPSRSVRFSRWSRSWLEAEREFSTAI
jgi:simple sugar transport system permease protein